MRRNANILAGTRTYKSRWLHLRWGGRSHRTLPTKLTGSILPGRRKTFLRTVWFGGNAIAVRKSRGTRATYKPSDVECTWAVLKGPHCLKAAQTFVSYRAEAGVIERKKICAHRVFGGADCCKGIRQEGKESRGQKLGRNSRLNKINVN